VEKIFPHMVSTDEQGMKSVAYNEFIPLLIEKVKEQDEADRIQTEIIASQKNMIEELEKRLNNLEKLMIQSKSKNDE
jgi:hypothetical protein